MRTVLLALLALTLAAPLADALQIRGEDTRSKGARDYPMRGRSGRTPDSADQDPRKEPLDLGDGGVTAARPRSAAGRELDPGGSWQLWWELHRDELLADQTLLPTGASSGLGILSGRGRRAERFLERPAGSADLVTPVLLQLLASNAEDNVRARAVLALARVIGPDPTDDELLALSTPLADSALAVQQAAALALGVSGDPDVVPVLVDLLDDNTAGRMVVGGGSVPWPVRARSALALGLLGTPEVLDPLFATVQDRGVNVEVRGAAVLGLALMQGPAADRASQFLVRRLEEGESQRAIAATMAVALGKLAHPVSVPYLHDLARGEGHDLLLRRCATVALGRAATMEDRVVVEGLLDRASSSGDELIRRESMLALGRIGGRAERPGDLELQTEVRRALLGHIEDPDHQVDRPWASLALALFSRDHDAERRAAVEVVRASFDDENDPAVKGADALALGLLDAASERRELLKVFRRTRDETLKSYLAAALGLIQDAEAEGALLVDLAAASTSDPYRRHLVRALALISATRTAPALLDVLNRHGASEAQASAAEALGRLRDVGSVPRLSEVATDPTVPAVTRATAAAALGMIAEKSRLPWQVRVVQDTHLLVELELPWLMLDL